MKYVLHILLALFFSTSLVAQNKDQTPVDANGKKHGAWMRFHENGTMRYQGTFNHGMPVDTFYHYFTDGDLQAMNVFDPDTAKMWTSFQYGGGRKLAAKGKYIDTNKVGKWEYYDVSGTLLSEEFYEKGVIDGFVNTYFSNGKLAQTLLYEDGVKHGPWKMFYEDGSVKVRGQYVDGHLQGTVYYFSTEGKVSAKGPYNKGLMAGVWKYYNDDGELKYQEKWVHGEKVSTTEEKKKEVSPSPIQSVDELREKYER